MNIKINITTDDGEVVEVLETKDYEDAPLFPSLWIDIEEAIARGKRMMGEERG